MDRFQSIFGIPTQDIRRTVVLLPFIQPGTLALLGIEKLQNGALYSSASTHCLSVIRTGIGAAFTGDAVLYLTETPVQNILFLGTCGLIQQTKDINTGSLVIPKLSYNMESFCDILLDDCSSPVAANCDPQLAHDARILTGLSLPEVCCASFGSLYLEEQNQPRLRALGIEVIDMECAALFFAAGKTGHRALALLSVTDIPGEKPYYSKTTSSDKKSLADNLSQACLAINKIARLYA
jgi:purine-nucleoside phosphorylase